MDDTGDIRRKMMMLWSKFDKGEIAAGEARTHIGFARTVLETLKVEIAAAHLAQVSVPVVDLEPRLNKPNGRKRLSA